MRIGDFRASYAHDESLLITRVQRSWMIGFVGLLLIFPWVGGSYFTYLACLTGVHVIAAMGLNIVTGFAGQISLGHAAFMGWGATPWHFWTSGGACLSTSPYRWPAWSVR